MLMSQGTIKPKSQWEIEMEQRNIPMKPIKEELGGDYYYRCPWLICNKVVRSDYIACPYCGQMLLFPKDDYED